MKNLFLLIAGLALTACGGTNTQSASVNTTGPTEPTYPDRTLFGTFPAKIHMSVDKRGDLTIDYSGSFTDPEQYTGFGQSLEGGFLGQDMFRDVAVYKNQKSGVVVAINASGTPATGGEAMDGIYIRKTAETVTLPTGTFEFKGDYRGTYSILGPVASRDHLAPTSGKVTLTGSFDGSISGTISNRHEGLPSKKGQALSTIILNSTKITDQGFKGTTIGGGSLTTPSGAGEYFGTFVTETGSEILGGVVIPQAVETDRKEWGVFTATQSANN